MLHRPHALALAVWAGASLGAQPDPASAGTRGPRVVASVPAPEGFLGHLAYDAEADRLFLVSFGPPASSSGSSRLFEIDRSTGGVLRTAELPFEGTFGAPAIVGDDLYQALYLQSRAYRISTARSEEFGRLLCEVPLPSILQVAGEVEPEKLRYPFVEVQALAAGDKAQRLVLQAPDLGALITISAATGRVLERVSTRPGLSGLAAPPAADPARRLLVANADPEASEVYSKVRAFNRRGPESVVPTKRSKAAFFARRDGERTLRWLLLDAASGDVLSVAEVTPANAWAGSVAVASHRDGDGPFGRFVLFALGPGGILTLEWEPSALAPAPAPHL